MDGEALMLLNKYTTVKPGIHELGSGNGAMMHFKLKLKLKLIYFLLSATSSMPLALYNGTHTLV